MPLFGLDADRAGPAGGIHDAGVHAVHGVDAGIGHLRRIFLFTGGGNDGHVGQRLHVPAGDVDILGYGHAYGELDDVLRVGSDMVQDRAVHLQVVAFGVEGGVAHARMGQEVHNVGMDLVFGTQVGDEGVGVHVGLALSHAHGGGQVQRHFVVGHGVQAVEVPARVQVHAVEVVGVFVIVRKASSF